MKRNVRKIVTAMLCVALLGTSTACGSKTSPKDCLDVFCMEAGYGVEWCSALLEEFSKQAWVKEKYPNLTTNFQHNDQKNYVESKLKAGAKNNTFDLLFGEASQTYIDLKNVAELTEGVYRKKIPGEDVTYEEKCFDSYNETNRYLESTSANTENRYYVASWAGGMNGIFYNADLLKGLNLSVPRTTAELEEACTKILEAKGNKNGKYSLGYSFIQSKGLGYLSYLFPIWWAQYEGLEGYTNYWNGIDDGTLSRNIFNQKGRLYSLQEFENLFFYDFNSQTEESNAYLTPSSLRYEYMTAQTMFLKGYGVFHVNGDWFENEMSSMKADIKKDEGIEYEIKLMRTPIISALGTKLGITETELRNAVDYVDGVTQVAPTFASTSNGYSAEEIIEAVKDARGIVNASGPYHTSMIPSYAQEKEIAMDFLLFMASDVAQETYIRATKGASLPFKYNVKEKNPELYNSLSNMQKERHDYFNDASLNICSLPNKEAFPLVRFGGLSEFSISNYYSIFSSSDNNKTAQQIFEDTKTAWNEKAWNDSLDKAGLN